MFCYLKREKIEYLFIYLNECLFRQDEKINYFILIDKLKKIKTLIDQNH